MANWANWSLSLRGKFGRKCRKERVEYKGGVEVEVPGDDLSNCADRSTRDGVNGGRSQRKMRCERAGFAEVWAYNASSRGDAYIQT